MWEFVLHVNIQVISAYSSYLRKKMNTLLLWCLHIRLIIPCSILSALTGHLGKLIDYVFIYISLCTDSTNIKYYVQRCYGHL